MQFIMSCFERLKTSEGDGTSSSSPPPRPLKKSKDAECFFTLTFNSNGAELDAAILKDLLADAAGASVAMLAFQE
jgi:hypothetical protein